MAGKINISPDLINIGITKFRKWHKKFAKDDMTADERFVNLGGKLPKPKKEDEDGN